LLAEMSNNCNGCKLPISGQATEALGHRWHPNCFVCAYCMTVLVPGGFREHMGKAYCSSCVAKYF
jgi:hypothetical protein